MVEVEVMRCIRVQVRHERFCVAVKCGGGLIIDPLAVAVADDVILNAGDGLKMSVQPMMK